MSRLVDADLLGLTDMEIIMCDGDYKEALKMLIDKIEHAPTIEPEIIHCKDCRHREHDEHYGYMCSLDTGDPYELGRCAEDENWFCADAERRENDT